MALKSLIATFIVAGVFCGASAGQPATQPARPVGITQFVRVGEGSVPIVLVPGFACDAGAFAEFMQRNSGQYTMYAITLPGFGSTAAPALPPNDDTTTPLLDNAANAIVDFV